MNIRRNELKSIIKECLIKEGFFDSFMTILSPTGKAKELTRQSKKVRLFKML